MISQSEIDKINKTTEELLQKMTIIDFALNIVVEKKDKGAADDEVKEVVLVDISLSKDPQFLIGQEGKNLFDLQRTLRMILNKKLGKSFYLKLDINGYQKQKIEYLKKMAKSLADEAVLTKEKKYLPPMSAYERRAVHEELAQRNDVATESYGYGPDRRILIIPL